MNRIEDLARAIAKEEGFYIKGTVPNRLNNPGDLIYVAQPDAKAHPITGRDGKVRLFAEFPDPETGWSALKSQLQRNLRKHPKLTLATLIGGERDEHGDLLPGGYPGWAPKSDANDPHSYAAHVAASLNVPPTTLLSELLS